MIYFSEDECVLLDTIISHPHFNQLVLNKMKRTIDNHIVLCYTLDKMPLKNHLRENGINHPLFLEKYSTVAFYIPLEYTSIERRKLQIEKRKENLMSLKPLKVKSISLKGLPTTHVPNKIKEFVPFGVYNDVYRIIKSGLFFPIYIHGLPGCGKTETAKQVCADLKRECIITAITKESDEGRLIGHYSLVDGNTVWEDGPVVVAMKRGAVLILDEYDLASSKAMCLQSIVNGDGYFIKQKQEYVKPEAGFTIIATANTKGRGDDTGTFTGTAIQNEAALDRFRIALEQVYPPVDIENEIVANYLKSTTNIRSLNDVDRRFIRELVNIADLNRVAYQNDKIDSVLTTRRLISMVQYYVFTNRDVDEVFARGFERFDANTVAALMELKELHWRDIYDENSDNESLYEGVETGDKIDGIDKSEFQRVGV